jgi:CheY-like chemotaxis protein
MMRSFARPRDKHFRIGTIPYSDEALHATSCWLAHMQPAVSVLLVDAHSDTREMYAEYLRLCGCDVAVADNLPYALTCAPSADVIVTETCLRSFDDGLDFIRVLKSRRDTRGKPVIVVSTQASPAGRAAAHAAGCSAFFAKPCSPIDLLQRIVSVAGDCGVNAGIEHRSAS